ncbi:protein ACCELERATED CELL DEATH 6 isoform X1 [Aegilops tauschii subsp. strangulata]|uniref:PGG domain-containing protein n=2 Tax=Aegilops tauschii TaxID=37682 RepID=A0A453QGE1_AEGTS|nr:ankyrin repeat-containing protein At5g02620 isoform X1 [Aegilops tauschii subsp. strangulata]
MDLGHHSIQLSAGPGSPAAATAPQPGDGGTMSPELYLALCRGRKKEAMALLRQQHGAAAANQVAGIQQVSAEGNNVLHLAAEHGHDKLIHCLMSFGDRSLLSSRNSTLDTPLHCAARAGHGKAVSLLVQLSCEGGDDSTLWCKNEAGNTALHLAARLGHGASVEAIVSVAPGLAFEVNNTGVSVLYLAVMSGSLPTVRSITTRCGNASAAGLSSQNALHAAVFQGSEMVRLLLEWTPCGPSLASQADGTGSTPLHFASSTGDHLSVVGAILRAVPPCVVRMRDSGGLSALHVAAGMGHDRVAESLIKACPDAAELRDDHGGTFLHAAARGGHLKVVRLAIKKRTLRGLLNAQDGDGNTPLHLAVAAGAPAVAEALMGKGKVRDDIMNNDGQTPLDLAVRSTSFFSMVSLVATLAAFGAQSRPERRDRVQQWDGREITKAIEKTSDSLAVIAVLVASVAFTAANNLPGSYEQSGGGTDPEGKEVIKGMAVLQNEAIFKCFLILDSFALVTSVLAVVLLLYGKASRSAGSWRTFAAALHCLWLSLVSMVLAFYAALAAVTSTAAVRSIAYNIIRNALFVLLAVVSHFVSPRVSSRTLSKYLWQCGSRGRRSVVVQQYPLVGAFMRNLILFRVANYVVVLVGVTTVLALR